MLNVLRVGCPWRDRHERYGKWNSVYVRFPRWAEQGVWDARLQTLVDLGLSDNWQHMIDRTTVRGHSKAAGAKGGLIEAAGVLRKKVHARTDGQGRPLGFVVTGGQVSDCVAVSNLFDLDVSKPRLMLADKGDDGDEVRHSLLVHDILPVIPPRAHQWQPIACDFLRYKGRTELSASSIG